jgi:hypothetical protein
MTPSAASASGNGLLNGGADWSIGCKVPVSIPNHQTINMHVALSICLNKLGLAIQKFKSPRDQDLSICQDQEVSMALYSLLLLILYV